MVQTHRILDFTTNIAKRGFRAGRPTRQGILQGAEERVFTFRGRPFPDPGALGRHPLAHVLVRRRRPDRRDIGPGYRLPRDAGRNRHQLRGLEGQAPPPAGLGCRGGPRGESRHRRFHPPFGSTCRPTRRQKTSGRGRMFKQHLTSGRKGFVSQLTKRVAAEV